MASVERRRLFGVSEGREKFIGELAKFAGAALAGAILTGAAFFPTIQSHEKRFEKVDAMATSLVRMEVHLEEMATKLADMHAREMRRLEGGSGR